ncbi:MAG: hypothetical protein KKH34_00690, partial [Candidatus Omnitrophica bacterium]|nr:hypothetical protein [Candidatus Omnitrophota bacterium]
MLQSTKRYNIWFRVIALILIKAFLLTDIVWAAGGDLRWLKETPSETSHLAPTTSIEKISFNERLGLIINLASALKLLKQAETPQQRLNLKAEFEKQGIKLYDPELGILVYEGEKEILYLYGADIEADKLPSFLRTAEKKMSFDGCVFVTVPKSEVKIDAEEEVREAVRKAKLKNASVDKIVTASGKRYARIITQEEFKKRFESLHSKSVVSKNEQELLNLVKQAILAGELTGEIITVEGVQYASWKEEKWEDQEKAALPMSKKNSFVRMDTSAGKTFAFFAAGILRSLTNKWKRDKDRSVKKEVIILSTEGYLVERDAKKAGRVNARFGLVTGFVVHDEAGGIKAYFVDKDGEKKETTEKDLFATADIIYINYATFTHLFEYDAYTKLKPEDTVLKWGEQIYSMGFDEGDVPLKFQRFNPCVISSSAEFSEEELKELAGQRLKMQEMADDLIHQGLLTVTKEKEGIKIGWKDIGLCKRDDASATVTLTKGRRGIKGGIDWLTEEIEKTDEYKNNKGRLFGFGDLSVWQEYVELSLSAYIYFERGKHYDVEADEVTKKNKITIIDKDSSGKRLEGRQWSYGRDTAVRIKENKLNSAGLELEPEKMNVASMTLPELLSEGLGLVSGYFAASATIGPDTAEFYNAEFIDLSKKDKPEKDKPETEKEQLLRTDYGYMLSDKKTEIEAARNRIVDLREVNLTKEMILKGLTEIGSILVRCDSDREVSLFVDNLVGQKFFSGKKVARLTQEGKITVNDKEVSDKTPADLMKMAEDDSEYDAVIVEFTSRNLKLVKDEVEELSKFKKVIIVSTNLSGRGVDFKGKNMVGISVGCDVLDENDIQFRGRVARDGRIGFWFGFWSLEDEVFIKNKNLIQEHIDFFKEKTKNKEYDLEFHDTASSVCRDNQKRISEMRKIINDYSQNMQRQEKEFYVDFLQGFNLEHIDFRNKMMNLSIEKLIGKDIHEAMVKRIAKEVNEKMSEDGKEAFSEEDIREIMVEKFGFAHMDIEYVEKYAAEKAVEGKTDKMDRKLAADIIYTIITDYIKMQVLQIIDQEWMRFITDTGLNKHRLQKLPSRSGYMKNFLHPHQIYAEIKRITARMNVSKDRRIEEKLAKGVVGFAYQAAGKEASEEDLARAGRELAKLKGKAFLKKLFANLALKIVPFTLAAGSMVGIAYYLLGGVYNYLSVGGIGALTSWPLLSKALVVLLSVGPVALAVGLVACAIISIMVGWALTSQVKRLAQVDSSQAKMADYVALLPTMSLAKMAKNFSAVKKDTNRARALIDTIQTNLLPFGKLVWDILGFASRKILQAIAAFSPLAAATTLFSLTATALLSGKIVGALFLLAPAFLGVIGVVSALLLLVLSRRDLKKAPQLPMSKGKRFFRGFIGGFLTTLSMSAVLLVSAGSSAVIVLIAGALAILIGGISAYGIFKASSDSVSKNRWMSLAGFSSGLIIGVALLGITAFWGAFVMKSILTAAGTGISSADLLSIAGYPLMALFALQGVLLAAAQLYFGKRIARQDAFAEGKTKEKKTGIAASLLRALVLHARTVVVSGGTIIGIIVLLKGVWMIALPIFLISILSGYLMRYIFKLRMEKRLDYSYLAQKPTMRFKRALKKLSSLGLEGVSHSLKETEAEFKELVIGTTHPTQLAKELLEASVGENKIMREFLTQLLAQDPQDGRFYSLQEIKKMVSKIPQDVLNDKQRPAFTKAVTAVLVELNLAKTGLSRFIYENSNAE